MGIFKKAEENKNKLFDKIIDRIKSQESKKYGDLPNYLLALEKSGVDTSEYFNKIQDGKLIEEDKKEIKDKLKINQSELKTYTLDDYVNWMIKDEKNTLKPIDKDEATKYLDLIRENFINFLVEEVLPEMKKTENKITPESLTEYYFENREKFENDLGKYDLMMGHTEGLLTDPDLKEEIKIPTNTIFKKTAK